MGRDFRKIKAWQYADDLAVLVYDKSRCFPKEERYGITSQLRRAAVSVPTNIAEGSGRSKGRDFLRFLTIARGSMAEIEYLLHLSSRIGYLKKSDCEQLEDKRKEAARTLSGLIGAVEKEIN
jgi:four helix bundle protein